MCKNKAVVRHINPYDLGSVSNADKKKPNHTNPHRENPYTLDRNRSPRVSNNISKSET